MAALLSLSLALAGCRSTAPVATVSPTPTTQPSPAPAPPEMPTSRPSLAPTPSRSLLTPLPSNGALAPTITPVCKPLPVASSLPYPGRAGQTWYASQIVVGIVIAQETRWEGTSSYQIVTTYSLFRVEERVRGTPFKEFLISQRAGTIDGCTQMNNDPFLPRDQRLLLFLSSDRQAASVFYVMFAEQGVYTGSAIDPTVAESRQILSQSPPANLSNDWIIPLDRAPIVAPATATPQP